MVKYIDCYKCNQDGETANVCRCDELSESTETAGSATKYFRIPPKEGIWFRDRLGYWGKTYTDVAEIIRISIDGDIFSR